MSKFNAAFWKWFGDSKVVDAKGNPLAVYHGTSATKFTKFRDNPIHYFSTNPDYATCVTKERGGDMHAMPVYLSVKNPLDATRFGVERISAAVFKFFLRDAQIDFDLPGYVSYDEESRWWRWLSDYRKGISTAAQAAGYDGIFMQEDAAGCPDSDLVIACFKPTQIKSATGNDGTWDLDDPDIRSNPNLTPIAPDGKYPPEMIDSETAEEWIRSIHPRANDFEDGDLLERIHGHAMYSLKEVNLASIALDDFEVSEGFVAALAKKIAKSKSYIVPFVSGDEIIDGAHRLNALAALGVKKAFVYQGR